MDKKLSEIFHDMKQPIVPISGYLQLLEMDLDEIGHKSEYLDKIKKSLHDLDISIKVAREQLRELYQTLSQD